MLSAMRIFAPHDGLGCGYYRVVVPVTELGRHGHVVSTPKQGGAEQSALVPRDWDVIIGQRFSNFEGTSWWRKQRTGTNRLVYETDDDIFSINPENEVAFAEYSKLSNRAAIQAYITYADLTTVTCEQLSSVMIQHATQTAVLPNFIRPKVLDLPRAGLHDGRRRLGYMGGGSHIKDLSLAVPAVEQFIRNNHDWDLHLVGTDYRGLFKLPPKRMKHSPWKSVADDERGFYESLDFDIALAPLADNRFNRSKTAIKGLEYNARGIPVIASDAGPYSSYVTHGVNGLLVKQPHEWLKWLRFLAKEHDYRETMSCCAKEVASEHTIDKNWQLWEAAYEGMFA